MKKNPLGHVRQVGQSSIPVAYHGGDQIRIVRYFDPPESRDTALEDVIAFTG